MQRALRAHLLQGTYLVADDEGSAEAWADAVLLCAYIARSRSEGALDEALQAGIGVGHY